MDTARSIAVGAAAALFSIALSLAVAAVAIEPAFSSSFYKDSFVRHNLYGRLRVAIAREQPELQASVNEELIRSVMESFMDNMFAYVRGETSEVMKVQGPFAPAALNTETLSQLRRAYQLRPALLLAFEGAAVIMLALMLYLTRSSKERARLVGKTLLFAGIGGLLTAFVVQNAVPSFPSPDSEAARVMAAVATETAKELVGTVMNTVLVYSAAFVAAGFLLWAVSRQLKGSGKTK